MLVPLLFPRGSAEVPGSGFEVWGVLAGFGVFGFFGGVWGLGFFGGRILVPSKLRDL